MKIEIEKAIVSYLKTRYKDVEQKGDQITFFKYTKDRVLTHYEEETITKELKRLGYKVEIILRTVGITKFMINS